MDALPFDAMTSSSSSTIENQFVDTERPAALLKGLGMLYEEKCFSDISLVVSTRKFICHRNVLAISSPYFMTMFSTEFSERSQSEILLQEMEASTLELILDYIYTGQVNLTAETVQDLLSAANLFQLLALRNGCAEYMIKHVNISNCIGVYFFAKAHHCDKLATKAKELINSQFEQLCYESEFLSLPADKLIEIIRDDELCVSKEEIVYEACLSWINSDPEERQSCLHEVMRHVRFANISSYYFCDHIATKSLLQNNPDTSQMLDRVKYYHMLRSRQEEVDLNFLPRNGMPYVRGVIILANPYAEENCGKFSRMEILMPNTGTIRMLCKLPHSLYMPAACTTGDNSIYLAGGAIRKTTNRGLSAIEGASQNLFLFDQSFGSWQVKAKMTHGRCHFAMVAVDGVIYVIGGQNGSNVLDSVEAYDQQHNTWKEVRSLPKHLRCLSAVGYRGKIYVFGGEHDGTISNQVFRYDPVTDAWLTLPSMQIPRALSGSVVFRDKIYVIGGNSASSPMWKKEFLPEHCISTVEIFDPATSAWSVGPELPNALCGAAVVKYGESILVVGGEDDKSWMAGLFMLKEEKGTGRQYWTEGKELTMVLSTFASVVANIPSSMVQNPDDT